MKTTELIAWAKQERVVPIDVFLNNVGVPIDAPAAFALYKHFGSIEKMLAWAQPGAFTTIKLHDVGKPTLIQLRAKLRDCTDLVELLLDHVKVVGTQAEYVRLKWNP